MGKRKEREDLEEQFRKNTPLLSGKPVNIEAKGTYLGEEIGLTVSESVTLTINKRIGLAKKAIFEIKFILEDCRSKIAGGLNTGLLIWESCIIPFILNNSSTWLDIKQKDIERLVKLQNLFLSVLLGIQNCPAVMMYWDLAILTIPNRILKNKLMFYHHIANLPDHALCRKILDTKVRLKLGGLHEEVRQFLARHQVIDIQKFTKPEWKRFVDRKLNLENREFLIQWSGKYKKVDSLSLACEEYERKEYLNKLNLAQSRIKFRERSSCMTTCRTDYPSDPGNIKAVFECFHCEKLDVLSHWRECNAYAKFRESKSLENDADLVLYYQQIIDFRRSELD